MRPLPAVLLVVALAAAPPAAASSIALEPPPEGRFVVDLAGLLDPDEEREVDEIAGTLFREHETPLFVVTIEAMADHWPHGEIRIETFAQLLFDQWQVGAAELRGEAWNTGILLLVSRDDRMARIQLGGGWGREQDAQCQRIMDGRIVPQFKSGRYGAGVLAGARALDEMARARSRPGTAGGARPAAPSSTAPSRGVSASRGGVSSPLPAVLGCMGIVLVVVVIGALLSMVSRSGGGYGVGPGGPGPGRGVGSGLGWGLGGLLGGFMLGRATSQRHRGSSGGRIFSGGFGGGGFSGGGFSGGGSRGGGFSRGGGATGKW